MNAYYNEFDPKTAEWLRELIKKGFIADGEVDERPIQDVRPDDVRGFTQVHLFAGIGGWSYALRLAGWPDDRPVWTGSCPCQPFSVAGRGLGEKDERHLWPEMLRLIRSCRPPVIMGEQVESAIGHGWLDGISADMENEGYSCWSAVLGAHSVGSPHRRNRIYWLGFSDLYGSLKGNKAAETSRHRGAAFSASWDDYFWGKFRAVVDVSGKKRRIPVEPAFYPLANGIPSGVVRLRGYGNAIVPQVAAVFIRAFMDTMEDVRENDRKRSV